MKEEIQSIDKLQRQVKYLEYTILFLLTVAVGILFEVIRFKILK